MTTETIAPARVRVRWRAYLGLCKLKVVALILFTAVVGMCLAAPEVSWQTLTWAGLGIGLMAASGAALNHVADRSLDAVMARTRHRPLPSGQLESRPAMVFAGMLGAGGMAILWRWVNPLTAVLTAISLVGYAVIYTRYLKPRTPQNIVFGGIAGAMPAVLGWTAVSGELEPRAWLLFLIIFTWTPPHFWPLAIYRRNEYAAGGIPMLPVTHGIAYTRRQILLYSLLLLAVSLLPFAVGMSGLFYLLAALILGGGFVYHAVLLELRRTDRAAMETFGYSVIYLMLLFAALLFDHYLPQFPG